MRKIACIVGARPNFMKIAPILRAMRPVEELQPTLVHTGQHYDANLSEVFFRELDIAPPDVSLEVGSGTHGKQTGEILIAVERLLMDGARCGAPFDMMLVVGDVNSTMAAALAAAKLHVPVAHVEAGLRSFDRSMPEEINRIVTDSISSLLLVSEPAGVENLLREGRPPESIKLVGNVMIDTLRHFLPQAKAGGILAHLGLERGNYGVVTLHRPANVDDSDRLRSILEVLAIASQRLPMAFPVHPRTRARIADSGLQRLLQGAPGLTLTEPLGYLDFLGLTSQAKAIVTDSGGLQEEATCLGVPCLTLRPNTERPITVSLGTSTLVDCPAGLQEHLTDVMEGRYKQGVVPELWDGDAAQRIVECLLAW
jgi:UDP-N-acetylglucosamine 2-epimerase (non-hydrolysing)